MKKCKVCGKKLYLNKNIKYEVTKYPVCLNALTQSSITYECFDCLHCGCQNIVNVKEQKNEFIPASD